MNEPGLEFVWVGDDAVDPLEQAQTLQILVGAGIKTREEARADLGLGPVAGGAPGEATEAPHAELQPSEERDAEVSRDTAS
jgi:capsid protein